MPAKGPARGQFSPSIVAFSGSETLTIRTLPRSLPGTCLLLPVSIAAFLHPFIYRFINSRSYVALPVKRLYVAAICNGRLSMMHPKKPASQRYWQC